MNLLKKLSSLLPFQGKTHPLFPFHIPWHICWVITENCNLRCIYCPSVLKENQRHVNQPAIIDKTVQDSVLEKIQNSKPEFLIISGGEPTLVKNLHEIIEKIRLCSPRTRLILNSNCLLTERVAGCLPNIHRLALSLDSLDDKQALTRGVEAGKVVQALQRLLFAARETNPSLSVTISAVATTHNLDSLPELIRGVHQIDERIEISIKPMFPFDNPISAFSTAASRERYLEHAQRYKHQACFYGDNKTDRVAGQRTCPSQFFKFDLDNTGNEHKCHFFRTENTRLHLFPCPTPCDCTDYIDNILFSSHPTDLKLNAKWIFENISRKTLLDTQSFLRRHVLPGYRMELLRYKK